MYEKTGELLSGIEEIYHATGILKDGSGKLDEGVADLILGIEELYDGTVEMKNGTLQMREETDGMDTEISDKIDELLDSITGGDSETVSFVSEKNTNVDSVQFVIQTDAVEKEDNTEVAEEEEESLTFIQKVLKLFGKES